MITFCLLLLSRAIPFLNSAVSFALEGEAPVRLGRGLVMGNNSLI